MLRGLFSPTSLSRSSTVANLAELDDDPAAVYEPVHVDGGQVGRAASPRPAERAAHVGQAEGGVRAHGDRDAPRFEEQQQYASRRLGRTPLGQLILPLVHSIYLMAGQIGTVHTPDVDHIAQLVEQVELSTGIDAVEDEELRNRRLAQGLLVNPQVGKCLVEPPSPDMFAPPGHDFLGPGNMGKLPSLKVVFPVTSFSGTSQDKVTVEEFLHSMTKGMELMRGRLTERDFRFLLQTRLTGRVLSSFRLWNENRDYTLSNLYSKLVQSFDSRETPADAKRKLQALDPTYFSSLSALLLRIEMLAKRASLEKVGRTSRDVIFNSLAVETLSRCLPEPYRSNANFQRVQLENLFGNDVTWQQYANIVEKWEANIDEILRKTFVKRNNRNPKNGQPGGGASAVFSTDSKGTSEHAPPLSKRGAKEANYLSGNGDDKVKQTWKSGADSAPPRTDAYLVPNSDGVCLKCRGKHESSKCDRIPGPVGRYPCRNCDLSLFHFDKHCPLPKRGAGLTQQESPKNN